MSQQNNYPSQWPKAFVVVFGTAALGATSYFLKEPQIMFGMIPLLWMVSWFD